MTGFFERLFSFALGRLTVKLSPSLDDFLFGCLRSVIFNLLVELMIADELESMHAVGSHDTTHVNSQAHVAQSCQSVTFSFAVRFDDLIEKSDFILGFLVSKVLVEIADNLYILPILIRNQIGENYGIVTVSHDKCLLGIVVLRGISTFKRNTEVKRSKASWLASPFFITIVYT